jgi:SAM-dependent methyltransferase
LQDIENESMAEFQKIIRDALVTGDCLALSLSKRRKVADDMPHKLTVRPVIVSDATVYQFASRRDGLETHENLEPADANRRVAELFGAAYAHCHLFTVKADYMARAATGGSIRVRKSAATKTRRVKTHNRAKNYLIADGEPCPFLIEIGVMTPAGRVHSSKYQKFRQINRYLELVNDVYDQLPTEGTLNVVDFGCGKSYLTFALHYLLTNVHARSVHIVGLDRKTDVINNCREIAKRLNCAGLEFQEGDISVHEANEPVHLAVSLHACDTATDDALAQAIRWRADVILAVPCCQHELANKIDSPALAGLLRHGILKERFAAEATDGLRAAALEICGYRTQVVEFIDMEHTPKNILLRATRAATDSRRIDQFVEEYKRLKESAGLESIYLEEALGALLTQQLARQPASVEQR